MPTGPAPGLRPDRPTTGRGWLPVPLPDPTATVDDLLSGVGNGLPFRSGVRQPAHPGQPRPSSPPSACSWASGRSATSCRWTCATRPTRSPPTSRTRPACSRATTSATWARRSAASASVDLAEGQVEVTLAIDDGREIPEGSSFAVRRKSAVGEPYVDIIPPEGASTDGPVMDRATTSRSSARLTPLSYSELFAALNDLVRHGPRGRPGHPAATSWRSALDGRAGSLRADDHRQRRRPRHLRRERRPPRELHRQPLPPGPGLRRAPRPPSARRWPTPSRSPGRLADARADLDRVLTDGNSLATRTADLLDEVRGRPELHDRRAVVARRRPGPRRGAGRPRADLAGVRDRRAVRGVPGRRRAREDDGPYIRAIPPLNVGGTDPCPGLPRAPRPARGPRPCPAAPRCTTWQPPAGPTTAGPGGCRSADGGPAPPGTLAPTRELAGRSGLVRTSEVGDGGFNPLLDRAGPPGRCPGRRPPALALAPAAVTSVSRSGQVHGREVGRLT